MAGALRRVDEGKKNGNLAESIDTLLALNEMDIAKSNKMKNMIL